MGSIHHAPHRHGPAIVLFALIALLVPQGCSSSRTSEQPSNAPIIRVRLAQSQDQVTLACGVPPTYQVAGQAPAAVNCPRNAIFTLSLGAQGWVAGNALLGGPGAPLVIQPEQDGTVSVNGIPYRGRFTFVPTGPGRFDIVNEVDVDSYLCSVVSREMLPGWHPEAYNAQAIVARTYAIYEKQTAGEIGRAHV